MKIAAIMPCYGRVKQTEQNIIRLMKTSGFQFQLICTTFEPELWKTLGTMGQYAPIIASYDKPLTYWEGMALGSKYAHDATHIVNLANDLLPGYNWLKKGVDAYIRRFGSEAALMGFNDGIHGPEHSSHFIIDVNLLSELGGWPTWYRHNYGDTELCYRTQAMERYGKSAWAVLYHNHKVTGADADEVYKIGESSFPEDLHLFTRRRELRWPSTNS